MFKLLKTVFKVGDATTKYPFKPYEVDDDFAANRSLIPINVSCAPPAPWPVRPMP